MIQLFLAPHTKCFLNWLTHLIKKRCLVTKAFAKVKEKVKGQRYVLKCLFTCIFLKAIFLCPSHINFLMEC